MITHFFFALAVILAIVVISSKSKSPLSTDVAKMLLGLSILEAGEEVVLIAAIPWRPRGSLPANWGALHSEHPPRFFVLTPKSILLLSLFRKELSLAHRTLFSELAGFGTHPEADRVRVDLKIRVDQTVWLTGPFQTQRGESGAGSAADLIRETILVARPELKRA